MYQFFAEICKYIFLKKYMNILYLACVFINHSPCAKHFPPGIWFIRTTSGCWLNWHAKLLKLCRAWSYIYAKNIFFTQMSDIGIFIYFSNQPGLPTSFNIRLLPWTKLNYLKYTEITFFTLSKTIFTTYIWLNPNQWPYICHQTWDADLFDSL